MDTPSYRALTPCHDLGYGPSMRSSALVVFALVLASCRYRQGSQRPPAPGEVVATYEGHSVTSGAVLERMQELPPPARASLVLPERKREFVENMILTDLLYEEGRVAGYPSDPAITSQPEQFQHALVVRKVMAADRNPQPVTDDEVRRYYDSHAREYKKKGKIPPFAGIKEPLRAFLAKQRVEERVQEHLAAVKQRADIRISEDVLARVDPLAGLKAHPQAPAETGH